MKSFQYYLLEVVSLKKPQVQLRVVELLPKEVEELGEGLSWLLSFSSTTRAYNSFEELLSEKNPDVVLKKVYENLQSSGVFENNETDPEKKRYVDELIKRYKEEVQNTVKQLQKLKRNGYYYLDYVDKYIFTVSNKLYYLSLRKNSVPGVGEARELRFDEIRNLDDYPNGNNFQANSLFSNRSAGSVLFRKVSAVVKKELPNWERVVFYFETQRESNESVSPKGTMRERLYKSVLQQMFGNVNTKQHGSVFAFSKLQKFE